MVEELQQEERLEVDEDLERAVKWFKLLGSHSYDARVYIALLRSHPATGYRVAKISDVPFPKAYNALKRLVAGGAALVVNDTKPVTYIPTPPAELFKSLRHIFSVTMDRLEEYCDEQYQRARLLSTVKDDYNG